jgi:hypothetical protein
MTVLFMSGYLWFVSLPWFFNNKKGDGSMNFSPFFYTDVAEGELEKKYNSDLEKERTDLGKSLYKNKEVYEHIQHIDPDCCKAIKQLAQEKQQQQKIREMDRGGMSL